MNFAGANCPDGSLFSPKVAGSVWVEANGLYRLRSCPPGYELNEALEECSLCPAFFYCPGGTAQRAPCPGGLFSTEGTNSSQSCRRVVFVVISLTFSLFINEISSEHQVVLRQDLAAVAGLEKSNVLIQGIASTSKQNTRVVCILATPSASPAADLRNKLSNLILDPAVLGEDLAPSSIDAVSVTGCMPGQELVVGADSLIGSDGTCLPCPASFYCIGGSAGRLPCPTGTFATAGSNSLEFCRPAVFVSLVIALPISKENFTLSQQNSFLRAVALAAGSDPEKSVILSIELQTRRSNPGGSDLIVTTQIAATDTSSAAAISQNIEESKLNAALLAAGLPTAVLKSVSVSETANQPTSTPVWVYASSIVGGFLAFILLISVAVWISLRKNESGEEKRLRMKIAEIRQELNISTTNGFYLSSERPPFWKSVRSVIFIRRTCLEAAARLLMGQDFDVLQFDSFCLSLEQGDEQKDKERHHKLCEWLLRICEELVHPDLEGYVPSLTFKDSASERFRYFTTRVCKARIWVDSSELFPALKVRVNKLMDEIGELCEIRFKALCEEPRGKELSTYQQPMNLKVTDLDANKSSNVSLESNGTTTIELEVRRQDHHKVGREDSRDCTDSG
jgi:hypothetical protein